MAKKVPAEMRTPELVTEYAELKCADARGERYSGTRHYRLTEIVEEMRARFLLDP